MTCLWDIVLVYNQFGIKRNKPHGQRKARFVLSARKGVIILTIKDTVLHLVRDYGTRNPFELAEYCGIYIVREDLGMLNGYYTCAFGVKSIHINENLTPNRQKICCAHELGHALLHEDLNTYFLISATMMLPDKYEKQANLFASYLLYPDDVLGSFEGWGTDEIAAALDAPKELLEMRWEYN